MWVKSSWCKGFERVFLTLSMSVPPLQACSLILPPFPFPPSIPLFPPSSPLPPQLSLHPASPYSSPSSSSLNLFCSVNSILTVLHFWRFCWNFLTFLTFLSFGILGPEWAILGVGVGSIHVVEQLSFSIIPSILAFEFDIIFGSFWLFGALMG